VELAGRRACSAAVLAGVRSVRRRAAPRHRHRCGRRPGGARADGRHRELRRVGARRRPRAHDQDGVRLLGHAAATCVDGGRPRRGRRGRRTGGNGRRERRRRHARAPCAPRDPADRRGGGIRRPARLPAASRERLAAAALRPRTGAATCAVTGSGAKARAAACRCSGSRTGARSAAGRGPNTRSSGGDPAGPSSCRGSWARLAAGAGAGLDACSGLGGGAVSAGACPGARCRPCRHGSWRIAASTLARTSRRPSRSFSRDRRLTFRRAARASRAARGPLARAACPRRRLVPRWEAEAFGRGPQHAAPSSRCRSERVAPREPPSTRPSQRRVRRADVARAGGARGHPKSAPYHCSR
jgi:hypothetical protein